MSNYKLSDVAKIITGYTFRNAIKPSAHGNYKIIQAKDIGNDLEIPSNNLTQTDLEKLNSNAIVKNGDVILTSRGRYQSAVIVSSESTIASSSVFIIRVTNLKLNPYYLAIFINSSHGQFQLAKLTSGNYIKSVPKSNLENLSIPIPPLSEQTRVVKLFQNIKLQQKLLKHKIEIISDISESSLVKILKNKSNHVTS